MTRAYRPPWYSRLARFTLRPPFRWLMRAAFRIRLYGFEHIPKQRPYVVIYNHVSILDPPLVLSFWPETLETVAAVEVFQRPG
ncbi:MAG: hypothetical protein GXO36_00075, partial [Chloroflexi bacterium]|nr:hypothetical protein [Chloroflexota bacterium]